MPARKIESKFLFIKYGMVYYAAYRKYDTKKISTQSNKITYIYASSKG